MLYNLIFKTNNNNKMGKKENVFKYNKTLNLRL